MLPVVRNKADRIVESARMMLRGHAEEAADWLIELGRSSSSDAVRLKAAESVLDRVGVRGGTEVDVNVSATVDPRDVLRDRLAELRRRTDAVDGELVAADDAEADGTVAPTDTTTTTEEQDDAGPAALDT